jgi:hypothetical protein
MFAHMTLNLHCNIQGFGFKRETMLTLIIRCVGYPLRCGNRAHLVRLQEQNGKPRTVLIETSAPAELGTNRYAYSIS